MFFLGAYQVLRAAKRLDVSVTLDDVVNYLRSLKSYTTHLHAKRKFKRQAVIGKHFDNRRQLVTYD